MKRRKQTHNKSFLFRFKSHKQFPLPTQFRPSPMTQYMLHSNASTTATQHHECYLMHLRNQNQHSQTGGVYLSLLSLSPLSTNSLNTKFTVPSVPWWFLSLSLSALQCLNCQAKLKLLQASVSRSPVQKSVKPHCSCTLPNLRCSTTHVLSPDYTISHLTHVAIQFSHEPRSLTKQKFDPPGSHATVSLSYYHLQAWRQAQ